MIAVLGLMEMLRVSHTYTVLSVFCDRRLFEPPSYVPFPVYERLIDRGCQLLRWYDVGGRWLNEYGAMVEWY
jgi:hypothetical protein